MSNSMLDILKNFNDASDVSKKSGPAEVGSMKAILEGFHNVAESDVAVDECGEGAMPMAPQMSPPQQQGNPVSMNVSLNASGKDNVDDLMALVRAVSGTEQHVDVDSHNVSGQEMDMAKMKAALMPKEEEVDEEGEWATSPDEEYQDHNYMTKDLSGGINREKPKGAERAKDPAVRQHVESIKDQLWAALTEKKTTEGKYKNDAQRKAVHAAKADKKK